MVAFARLLWWLLLLSYAEPEPPAIRLGLITMWIGAFCWRYVFRKSSNPAEQKRLTQWRAKMGLSFSADLVPYVAALCAILMIAVPWSGAAITGGCRAATWFESVSPPRPLTGSELPFVFGPLLVLFQTATYPLLEEFSMRGWLLVPLRERIGTHWAIFAIAVVFALLHLTPYPSQLVILFLFSILVSYAVIATGSLWTAFAMHYTWNFTLYLLASPLHRYFGEAFGTSVFRCGPSRVITVVASGAFAAVLIAAHRRIPASKGLNSK